MDSMTETSLASQSPDGPEPTLGQEPVTWLDSLPLSQASVGYGELGSRGSLGYEGKQVIVGGQHYPHALSTHPPASLVFQAAGRFNFFKCRVALNGDVPAGRSRADFRVLVDGRQVALASSVVAGARPQMLLADLRGAQQLELIVQTNHWEFCHAVWLDPQLSETEFTAVEDTLTDCLGRAEITVSPHQP